MQATTGPYTKLSSRPYLSTSLSALRTLRTKSTKHHYHQSTSNIQVRRVSRPLSSDLNPKKKLTKHRPFAHHRRSRSPQKRLHEPPGARPHVQDFARGLPPHRSQVPSPVAGEPAQGVPARELLPAEVQQLRSPEVRSISHTLHHSELELTTTPRLIVPPPPAPSRPMIEGRYSDLSASRAYNI